MHNLRKKKRNKLIKWWLGLSEKSLFGKKIAGGIGSSGAELFSKWQEEELKHWQKNAALLIKALVKDKFPELDENSYKIEWGIKIER